MPLKQYLQASPTTETRGPDILNLPKSDWIGKAASAASRFCGGRWGFSTAAGVVVLWALSGPVFHFSDTWQLLVNTGTGIVTFLMVFLIQNAQNRDSKAINLKLDELILSTRRARNELIDVEMLTDEQLDRLSERYRGISERCQKNIESHEFLNPDPAHHEQPAPAGVTAEPVLLPRPAAASTEKAKAG